MAKHKVLVVEDDGALRSNLSEVFSLNDFEVRQASDGLEAIDRVRGERPDLVVMDVSMPRMGGLEALRKIKEVDPSIVVIIVTAYSALEDAVRAVKDGAYNYLPKPIKQQALVEMVQRALEAPE